LKWAWAIAVLAAACTLGTGTFAGKTCSTNVDCPSPYVCAQVRPGERTCELLQGVEVFDPAAAVPADYCHDVKPVLDRTCIVNCHGEVKDYPGSPPGFRLDRYETVGTVLGAGAKAGTIKLRVDQDTMPPMEPSLMRPTQAEKLILTRWVNAGAPQCLDGGSDAGAGDAGDGG
jgi:hypothetical protein